MIDEAVELTPIGKYLEDRKKVEETKNFLLNFGGRHLEGNPYKDTIVRLEGILSGMRLCEIAMDL